MFKPPSIRTSTSNPFAHYTTTVRNPRLLGEIQAANPDYPAPVKDALERLRDDLLKDAPIPLLALPAPDYESWQAAHEAHAGETWQDSAWFYNEVYFYRLIMQAVRWWESGRDPFAPRKAEEYASEALWTLVERTLSIDGTPEDSLMGLLDAALWGNRIDLSYAEVLGHGTGSDDADLLVDDRAWAVERILSGSGPLHIVADNAGTELAMDMVLIDRLLNHVDEIVMHVKWHPTYVSDTTVPDVHYFLRALTQHGPAATALSERLQAAFDAGRLRLAPDLFWNSSQFLPQMPSRLMQTFAGARLVLFKGDANYRRISEDRLWPTETPLAQITGYFPAPMLLLRTCKSDSILGLPAGLADTLDSEDDQWRVNGRRGVIQGVDRPAYS